MRPPDRLSCEASRIAPMFVVEGWQGIEELLDFERRRQLGEYSTLTFLG